MVVSAFRYSFLKYWNVFSLSLSIVDSIYGYYFFNQTNPFKNKGTNFRISKKVELDNFKAGR
jgi:hypothetical protein